MEPRAVAYANNDIAYLWWRYPAKLADCLGFSVHRVNRNGTERALPAYVGFDADTQAGQGMRTTDEWPVQAFQWKDVYAAPGTYRYRIVPMIGATPDTIQPDDANAVTTDPVRITGDYGDIEAYFNVGLISTQAVTKRLDALVAAGTYPSRTAALRGEITVPGSEVRSRLAGQVLDRGLLRLIDRARERGGYCLLALYELADPELIDTLIASRDLIAVCLANADSSEQYVGADGKTHTRRIKDGTNAVARARLHAEGVETTDRFVSSSAIGHNKFAVHIDDEGRSAAVLTGSTNWTSTGLCTQTNNALIIRNRTIAEGYTDYWSYLAWDAGQPKRQGPDLREWNGDGAIEATVDGANVRVWFAPNTARATKDPDAIPPDLDEVYDLIDAAQHGVLFLAFNPGQPSCLEQIRLKALAMRDEEKPFYVRGAVTDNAPLGQFATFLTQRDAAVKPSVLVSGVAGVPDDFGFWEEELYKIGHAVIHDKVIVIDPFTEHCVVVTGSHNLGYKASYQNDENLVIVRGHRRLAEAYAVHVLDVTNHFAWRYKLNRLYREGRLREAWRDLAETPAWQDKYFGERSLLTRDAHFFGL